MKIYDQSLAPKGKDRGTCSFYAVLGAIVDRYSLETLQEKLEEYIEASKRRKAGIPWILQYLKDHPFEGYRCNNWQIIFNKKIQHFEAPMMSRVRDAVRYNDKILVVLLPVKHKQKPLFHLTKDHYVVSYSGLPMIEPHGFYIRGFHPEKKFDYELRNSWGESWGSSGSCYITTEHFYHDVVAVYSAEFEKVT